MQESEQAKLDELLEFIDKALEASPVLTDERRLGDIENAREKVVQLCEESKFEDADRMARLCVDLIRQDEPTKE